MVINLTFTIPVEARPMDRADSRRIAHYNTRLGREIRIPRSWFSPASSLPRWRALPCVFLTLVLAMLSVSRTAAQGVLTNGLAQDGAISAAAETATWTIAATKGDRVVVQIAKLTGGAGFTPAIEILAPNGFPQGTKSGGVAARLDVQAEFTGTYTVNVMDANRTGSGTYRLRLAQVPLAFTVPSGDEGGPLTNGASHQGTI
ncbi:MAG: hypothetical protein NT154_15955, partial [Verrucomicrobia bacterium]|nr:hypothetical protein [Verrucomicrobiota bacterium]